MHEDLSEQQPDTRFVYKPYIRCLDCTGMLHEIAPGRLLFNFGMRQLGNRLHQARLEKRTSDA